MSLCNAIKKNGDKCTYKSKQNGYCLHHAKINKHENNQISDITHHECPICYDTINDVNEIFNLPCKHIFHRTCLERWIQTSNSCPMCRQTIQIQGHCTNSHEPIKNRIRSWFLEYTHDDIIHIIEAVHIDVYPVVMEYLLEIILEKLNTNIHDISLSHYDLHFIEQIIHISYTVNSDRLDTLRSQILHMITTT